MENEIMNIEELSKYLRCSISTIRNLVRNKEINSFRVGNRLFFRKSSINSWILQQEISNIQDNNFETKIKPLKREVI